jgi:signal peptidase II
MLKYKIKIIYTIIIILGIFADQLLKKNILNNFTTKNIMMKKSSSFEKCFYLKKYWNKKHVFIDNFLNTVYRKNNCIAFSLSLNIPKYGRILFFSFVANISLIFIVFFFINNKKRILMPTSFIILGALGNIFNRLKYESVIDSIDLHIQIHKIQNFHFATFNLADFFISIGIFLLIINIIFYNTKKQFDVFS